MSRGLRASDLEPRVARTLVALAGYWAPLNFDSPPAKSVTTEDTGIHRGNTWIDAIRDIEWLKYLMDLDFEWVQDGDTELGEIPFVSGGHDQAMDTGGGGDHGILHQVARLAGHDTAPLAKAGGVHGKHPVNSRHTVNPALQFGRLRGILPSGPLDPHLQLSQRHGGNE